MLRFLSTNSVKERIINGELSENAVLIYFFITVIYDSFFHSLAASRVESVADSFWYQIVAWSFFACTVAIWLVCFVVNGAFNGSGLLTKVFPLSITVGYKYAIALWVAGYSFGYQFNDKPIWFDAALVYTVNTFLAINISYHLVSINRAVANKLFKLTALRASA